jgi:hypothetical protein
MLTMKALTGTSVKGAAAEGVDVVALKRIHDRTLFDLRSTRIQLYKPIHPQGTVAIAVFLQLTCTAPGLGITALGGILPSLNAL